MEYFSKSIWTIHISSIAELIADNESNSLLNVDCAKSLNSHIEYFKPENQILDDDIIQMICYLDTISSLNINHGDSTCKLETHESIKNTANQLVEKYPNILQKISIWNTYLHQSDYCDVFFLALYQKIGLNKNVELIFNICCRKLYKNLKNKDYKYNNSKSDINNIFIKHSDRLRISYIIQILNTFATIRENDPYRNQLLQIFFLKIKHSSDKVIFFENVMLHGSNNYNVPIILELVGNLSNESDEELINMACECLKKNSQISISPDLYIKLKSQLGERTVTICGDIYDYIITHNLSFEDAEDLITKVNIQNSQCNIIDNFGLILEKYKDKLQPLTINKLINGINLKTVDVEYLKLIIDKFKHNEVIFLKILETIFNTDKLREKLLNIMQKSYDELLIQNIGAIFAKELNYNCISYYLILLMDLHLENKVKNYIDNLSWTTIQYDKLIVRLKSEKADVPMKDSNSFDKVIKRINIEKILEHMKVNGLCDETNIDYEYLVMRKIFLFENVCDYIDEKNLAQIISEYVLS